MLSLLVPSRLVSKQLQYQSECSMLPIWKFQKRLKMAITLKDIREHRSKIAEDRKRLEKQDEALCALESTLSDEHIYIDPQSRIDLGVLPVNKNDTKQSFVDVVRTIVQRLSDQEFGVSQVETVLIQQGKLPKGKTPRASIAHVLSSLEKKGEVERTFKGVGNDPHRFRLTNTRASNKE